MGGRSSLAPQSDAWPEVPVNVWLANVSIKQRVPLALSAFCEHETPEHHTLAPKLASEVHVHINCFTPAAPHAQDARQGIVQRGDCARH